VLFFFNRNSARGGKDVSVQDTIFDEFSEPFSFSYSTNTGSRRVFHYISGDLTQLIVDDWLLSVSTYFIQVVGGGGGMDTFGCGINSSFPCESEKWGCSHPLPGVLLLLPLCPYLSPIISVKGGFDDSLI
jgi:hypothetical protein